MTRDFLELLAFLLVLALVWAAFDGVTIHGVHHQVKLTDDAGVVVE